MPINRYKYVMKHGQLYDFLLETHPFEEVMGLKYKTIERESETIHHYGWNYPHVYAIGIYQINNGIQIKFDYCYEVDSEHLYNIKKVVYFKLTRIGML